MLVKYLKAALVFAMVSAASAQSIVFVDYNSSYSVVLPSAITNSQLDTRSYNTYLPGLIRFGVDWNNDASDEFTITIPQGVTVTAENSPDFCTPQSTTTPPNQITFTNDSVHQCNYTASWNTPINGKLLTVTYDSGPEGEGATGVSDAISIQLISSAVVGDPQFVGLRGQSYQVHGVDGAVYNLISEKNTQVNARFTFLTEGECPIINGVADTNCWSHPGSYLGEMSFQQVVAGKLHAALLTAGDAKKGFAAVQVDGKALKVGDKVAFGSFSLEMKSAYAVTVNTENFEFDLSNSDMFINQALRSKVALSKLHAHGLIGQTHSSKTYTNALKHVEGEVDDYVVADNDLFGDAFVFNQFKA